MGYPHDCVLGAPGVANDPKASWRLLGNSIQLEATLCGMMSDDA